MTVRAVLRMGDPALRVAAAPASGLDAAALDGIVVDLLDTMAAMDGAGLAAPQIGIPYRVVAFGLKNNPRYPEAEPLPLTVLIDPAVEALETETEEGWEGCLSVPGMRGLVTRWRRIRYAGGTPGGERVIREAAGFHARVVQHECDHLDGVLYPDRIENRRMFGFIGELQAAGLLGGPALPEE
ncbi:MAG: peptide deformylase [Alphaproteobacteria bacterium]|nr:peptide deformylase [Alphaproteobacteria bacterium]